VIPGFVVFDDTVIGAFKVAPYPHEELVVTFNEGLRVEKVFEDAAATGTAIQLVVFK